MTMDLKTPLYDCHVALEGRMVPFAGYVLPVQYPTGVIREHMAVREACGLFDVSHMGEVLYKGPDALPISRSCSPMTFSTMRDGKVRYSVMCNPKGRRGGRSDCLPLLAGCVLGGGQRGQPPQGRKLDA